MHQQSESTVLFFFAARVRIVRRVSPLGHVVVGACPAPDRSGVQEGRGVARRRPHDRPKGPRSTQEKK